MDGVAHSYKHDQEKKQAMNITRQSKDDDDRDVNPICSSCYVCATVKKSILF
jgi:hypothetical protein